VTLACRAKSPQGARAAGRSPEKTSWLRWDFLLLGPPSSAWAVSVSLTGTRLRDRASSQRFGNPLSGCKSLISNIGEPACVRSVPGENRPVGLQGRSLHQGGRGTCSRRREDTSPRRVHGVVSERRTDGFVGLRRRGRALRGPGRHHLHAPDEIAPG